MNIARGSTCDFSVRFPEGTDLSMAKEIWLTIAQDNGIKLDLKLTEADFEIDGRDLLVHLSQEQTLNLHSGDAKLQVRLLMLDDAAYVTYPIIKLCVLPILKDGEIS